jgi:acyl-CoA thioester hydrolase
MKLHPADIIRDGRHRYQVRVYYEDTDAGGVVYHGNYLRLAERARTEALRDLGIPHAEMTQRFGLVLLVQRVKVDYLAPARLDDSLIVVSRPLSVGAASVELSQSFHRDGEAERVLAAAEIRLACVRVADGRPERLPPRWRETLRAMAEASAAADRM